MPTVTDQQLSKDMQGCAQLLTARAGLIPQDADRPLEASDLLFYLTGTSMPMAAFLKDHGLFMDGAGLHFDLAQFGAIRKVAQEVVSQGEAGNREGVWKQFDLDEDEDADTNGGYILVALDALELMYGPGR